MARSTPIFTWCGSRSAGPSAWGRRSSVATWRATYRHFPYQLEHVSGQLTLEGQRLSVELHGLIGERPAVMKGTIDNPGPDAIVRLQIHAESVPIDDAFLAALRPRPEILKVVNDFHPSGSIKADVRVTRKPLWSGRWSRKRADLVIDADLDLNPRCEITWVGLPYTVRNLTGRLELHPDLWDIQEHARAQRPGADHRQRQGAEAARTQTAQR